jgi:C1A family cysteine protease
MRSFLRLSLLLTLTLHVITQSNRRNNTDEGDDDNFNRYQSFMKRHNKIYRNPGEMTKRFQRYSENLKQIMRLKNRTESEEGFRDRVLPSDQLELDDTNQFMDLSPEEFSNMYLTFKRPGADEILRAQTPGPETLMAESDHDLRFLQTAPTSFDWRTKGAVGPVKNQGSCGSCYAFSVAANLEGLYAIKYQKLLSFSEQQIVNCDSKNLGCNGGWMATTYTYLKGSNGLGLTSSLKYIGVKQTCSAVPGVAKVTGYKFAGTTADAAIAKFLVSTGPLSAALNANSFQYYKSGVLRLSAAACPASNLNHAITLVGYGNSNGVNYWIVKNSWSATWGESGYIRVAWGTCGINTYVLSGTIV